MNRNRIRIIGLVAWLLFACSLLIPDYLWGVNHITFLPIWVTLPLFTISIALIFTPISVWKFFPLPAPNWFLRLSIAISVAILCWNYPIPYDLYGDALFVKPAVDFEIPEWDDRLKEGVFEFDILNTKSGLDTYYQLNNFGAWLLGLNGTIVTRIYQSVLVFMFLILWMSICSILFRKSTGWYWLFSIVGFTTPLLICFMGHYEYYFLGYTVIMIWFYLLTKYFFDDKKWVLYILPIAFLLLIQTHITCWLLLPSLVYPYLQILEKRFPILQPLSTNRGMWIVYGGGFLVVISIAYFFIYQNYNGPRAFGMEEFENSLFLPLYTIEKPPLDRYNLFSLSHILDYVNLTLFWFGPVVILWLLFFIARPKTSTTQAKYTHLLGLLTAVYLVSFFMLNPLLGATLDWDLFVLPALVFLISVATKVSLAQEQLNPSSYAGPILGLSLLGASFFPVHASNNMLGERYQCLGLHHFKTYWIGSSTCTRGAAEMLAETPEEEQQLIVRALNELHPYAIENDDLEYAGILHHLGLLYKRQGKNETAYKWFSEAAKYQSNYGSNLYQLTIVCFNLSRYDEALVNVSKLFELHYQPLQRTVRMGIHIALAAKQYQDAANFAVFYKKRWPDDNHILEVEYRLRNGIGVETIIETFNNAPIEPSE